MRYIGKYFSSGIQFKMSPCEWFSQANSSISISDQNQPKFFIILLRYGSGNQIWLRSSPSATHGSMWAHWNKSTVVSVGWHLFAPWD